MTAIAVFCGASLGSDPIYEKAAIQLGTAIARAGKTLVYGGGNIGLMGAVSNACLQAEGSVKGVLPTAFLSDERHLVSRGPRDEQIHVISMHERKLMMADMSSSFIGLPGGYGTLEEVAEMTTWTQLGIQRKAVILLNVNGYYNALRQFVDNGIDAQFIRKSHKNCLIFVDAPEGESSESVDWGLLALAAIEDWERSGLRGIRPASFEWKNNTPADLR